MCIARQVSMPDLEAINKVNVLTDRVKRRKEAYLSAKPRICPERSRLATESWRETEGQPLAIRRARLFEKLLEGIPVVIRDGELIVGSQTKYIRGCYACVDWNPYVALEETYAEMATTGGECVEADFLEDDRKSVREDASFWRGKTAGEKMEEAWRAVFGSLIDDFCEARLTSKSSGYPPATRDMDYEKVLNRGLVGVIEEAREELQGLSRFDGEEVGKFYFLQAVNIALGAVIKYASRHAKLAKELAAKEKDAVRKRELERLAEICERVPKNPARNLYEAVQSFWFLVLALNQETSGLGESLGRFDQFVYPFYEKDVKEGSLTRQQAAEFLSCLWIKFAEMESLKDPGMKVREQGSQVMNLTIGGVTKEGEDATNELSHLILEVNRQLRVHQPHLTLRYHDGLSEAFLIKAVETNRDIHGGIPRVRTSPD